MKKNLAFVIYRRWAFEIVRQMAAFGKATQFANTVGLITTKEREFSIDEAAKITTVYTVEANDNKKIYEILQRNKVDVAFFYGWSWIVAKNITNDFLCLCLHPSPLPQYRGGTPIQHQVMNGEVKSAVSVFKMSQGIDDGDIYMQLPMSLQGDINDIFRRMVRLGTQITRRFLVDFNRGNVNFAPQEKLHEHPPLKRRKPQDSEVRLQDLHEIEYEQLYNLVRGLLDPFPNAFIDLGNTKLKIQKIKRCQKATAGSVVLNGANNGGGPHWGISNSNVFLKVRDGYAQILQYELEEHERTEPLLVVS
jgi:methionyl-tRNA formyltransferase